VHVNSPHVTAVGTWIRARYRRAIVMQDGVCLIQHGKKMINEFFGEHWVARFLAMIFLSVAGLATAGAHGGEVDGGYSLTPFRSCRTAPKAPPHRMLNMRYLAANTPTNGPFDNSVDINGDGWCDWTSAAAMPAHRGDIEEPAIRDFIFLGTKGGWHRYGDRRKLLADPSATSFSRPLLVPTSQAASLVAPVYVYSRASRSPYVVAIYLNEDILDANRTNLSVYQWDGTFSLLRQVDDQDREAVLHFLQDAECPLDRKRGNAVSVAQAICGPQPELVR